MSDYSLTYKNKTFDSEKVELDGKRFENCDFKNCLVIGEQGDTRLINCRIDNCKLLLKETPIPSVRLLPCLTRGGSLR